MDFYYMLLSVPCRGPMLTASALGLNMNLKTVNLFEGENTKPEFIAINPQHCVPVLVDGDLTLWESRAISAYLVNKYGKDGSLYPKDPTKRAHVDKMLYFDMGTLYLRYSQYTYPVFHESQPKPENLQNLYEALGWLEGYLKTSKFVSGPDLTIADHALVATVTTIAASGVDITQFPKVTAWIAVCKATMPGFKLNEEGAQACGDLVKSKFAAAAKL